MGHRAGRRRSAVVGRAADRSARLRPLPGQFRRANRDPADRPARPRPAAPSAVSVLGAGGHRAAARGSSDALPDACGDFRVLRRADGLNRHAHRRGDGAGPRPRGPATRDADGARHQVRQVALGPSARQRDRATRPLPASARPALPAAGQPGVLPVWCWDTTQPHQRQHGLQQAVDGGRNPGRGQAASLRPTPYLYSHHPGRLVHPELGRRAPTADVVDLPRAHQPRNNLLVSAGS